MKSVVQSLLGQFNASSINEAHPKLNAIKLGKFIDIFRASIEKNKITKPGNKTEIDDAAVTVEDIDLQDSYLYLRGQKPWRAKSNGKLVALAVYDGNNPLMLVNLRNAIDISTKYDKQSKCIVGYDFTSIGQEKIDVISKNINNYWGNGSINNKSDFTGEIRSSSTLNIVISTLADQVPNLTVKVIYQDTNHRYNIQRSRQEMRPGETDSLDSRLDKYKNTKSMPNENKFNKGQEKELILRCADIDSNGKSRLLDEVGIEYDGKVYVLEYVTTDGSNNLINLMSGSRESVARVILRNKGYSIATTAEKSIMIEAKFIVSIDKAVVKDR